MEVSEVKDRKYKLEEAISDMLREFQNDCDVAVTGINRGMMGFGGGTYTVRLDVEVK